MTEMTPTLAFGTPSKRVIEHCVICKNPLFLPFPNDFPDRFKFCCICRSIAEMVLLDEPIPIGDSFQPISPTGSLINKIDVWLTIGA